MGTEAETVERVGHLVTAAGATLKDKRRPIKVIGRDGAVKKTIPHVEVIEGLLHHEGISGALESGIRPKTILCEVCRCVVDVKKGTIPRTCARHARKKLCPRGCGKPIELKSEYCMTCRTPEEWRHIRKAAHEKKTPEQRSEISRKRIQSMTPEQRSEISRKRNAAMTPEQRSKAKRKMYAGMTPEQISARACKGWETRRAKQAAKG